jgi:hypothetical protein
LAAALIGRDGISGPNAEASSTRQLLVTTSNPPISNHVVVPRLHPKTDIER